ncbi:MAG: hypothetical protein ABUK01_05980 [Leptospirales bacterium]
MRIASMDSNGTAAYYLANHVDSVKIVTDDTGASVAVPSIYRMARHSSKKATSIFSMHRRG